MNKSAGRLIAGPIPKYWMRNFIQLIEALKLGSNMTTVDLDKNEVVQPQGVIKIGSNPAKAKCMAALEEWDQMTHEHPMSRGYRLTDAAAVDMSCFDGSLHISDVMAIGAPRTGGGTRAIQMVCDLADKHGVKVTLTAKAYTDERMSTRQLKRWYERFGFHEEEDGYGDDREGYDMIRYPN